LRHRLVQPAEIQSLLVRAGLALVATWGGFDGRPLVPGDGQTEQHVYLAQRPSVYKKAGNRRKPVGNIP
jgi:hypothetical protein